MSEAAAGDLELGGTLALTGTDAFASLHTGVTLEALLFNVYARREWQLDSHSIGGGLRFMRTFGLPGLCLPGYS